MSTSIAISEPIYYRVNHPEFDPEKAYKALAYIDYGESAWSKLLFINERGMTYGVKVHRCLCVNAIGIGSINAILEGNDAADKGRLVAGIWSEQVRKAPWPKPRCKNPDLDDD